MGIGQFDTVRELMQESGYKDVCARRDLAGIDRIAIANIPGA